MEDMGESVPLSWEADPLFGERPFSELRMPLQAKAVVAAKRHLHAAHGIGRERLREGRVAVILEWHLEAHGLPLDTSVRPTSMPWGLVEFPHTLVERRTQGDRGGPSNSA
jgi:hypothetical protein